MNRVILCGNLGKAPEVRQTKAGLAVANFSIATKEFRPGPNGAKGEDHTEWHNIIVWGKLAENCGKFLNKGSKALVEGKNATRKWQDKGGVDHYSTEIIANHVEFLDPAPGRGDRPPMPEPEFPQKEPAAGGGGTGDPFLDDIPFARLSEWG